MPRGMTARDILNQDFHRKMRGYDPDDVDMFLRSVAEEVERLTLENGELLEEMGSLRRELEEVRADQRALQETLVSAQRMAEEIKLQAGREGELVVREARLRAERLQGEAQDCLSRLDSDISRAKLDREMFERQLRGVVEQHLALLDMRKDARDDLDNLRVLPKRAGSESG